MSVCLSDTTYYDASVADVAKVAAIVTLKEENTRKDV